MKPTDTLPADPDNDGPSRFDLRRESARVLLFQAAALLGLALLQSCFGTV